MHAATLLWLGLFLGQAPSDIVYTNQRGQRIPLNFQEARQSDIRELILYVSNDQGKSWQQRETVSGDSKFFNFTAPTDGQYWLQVATVNRQGKQEPENILQSPAQQKMIVDTLKPLVRIASAQRQGDEIVLNWEIQEDNPDWTTLKLEYQAQPSLQWHPVQVTPGATGQARVRPGSTATVALRLQLRDLAGNVSQGASEVPGTTSVAQESRPVTPPPTPSPVAPPPPPSFPTAEKTATPLPSPALTPAPMPTPLPTPPALAEAPRESFRMPPSAPPVDTISRAAWTPPAATPRQETKMLVATSEQPVSVATPPPAAVVAPRKALPALQYVNSPEVTLEYELTKVGPSGVGSVDLWWTQNDGQTWERYAFDPETKGPGRHQRIVEVPGDGVYGFVLVVKSRAGLGRRDPRPGDAPEIRVEVDTSSPVAQLYAPVPDSQRANALILSWAAKDNNLSTHPINLEWAERREGPWHPIATNLANNGKHSWQLPDQLPVQVYLRLRARDCAGNEGVAVTAEPQLVDLSEPEARLLNVSVPPRR